MNRKYKLLWTMALFIGLFTCLPVVMGGTPMPFSLSPGDSGYIMLSMGAAENLSISFEGDGIIDVFVTNTTTDGNLYMATGVIPSTATVVASHTGFSGTLCIIPPELGLFYYLYFGNKNGATTVTGTYELNWDSCEIPGIPSFEIVFVFCALIATFGILWSKKKLYF